MVLPKNSSTKITHNDYSDQQKSDRNVEGLTSTCCVFLGLDPYAEKMLFARLEFSRFLICCSGDLSDNESEEKPYVAIICGGSICISTGLQWKWE